MMHLDLALTALVIAAAAAFLGWRLLPGRSTPACHRALGTPRTPRPEPEVHVGGALARGLAAARARQK